VIQTCLNVVIGLVLLIFCGWKWYRCELNLWLFAIALFHFIIGLIIFSFEFISEKETHHYLFAQKRVNDIHVVANIRKRTDLNPFLYLYITAISIGLALIFAASCDRRIFRVVVALLILAIFSIIFVYIFQDKILMSYSQGIFKFNQFEKNLKSG
jgi:hypothetical protein